MGWISFKGKNPETGATGKNEEGLFGRLRAGLAKTRKGLLGKLGDLIPGRGRLDEATLEELEEILIASDLGVTATAKVMAELKESTRGAFLEGSRELVQRLEAILQKTLEEAGRGAASPPPAEPWVIMVVGVNGSGKTTTAGKLAHRFRREGKGVLMAAADTFRAAASEQLEVWAERTGSELVRLGDGADPSAVAYDAIEAARARGCQVVIADTAGRLHTKRNLMEELKKVKRVMGKLMPGAPHEVLLVLDATTGQNALAQARLFGQEVGVTGIALTKLDGTAKGGIVVAVARETGIPIKFVGVGEGVEDLREFDPQSFIRALFED